jgi:hypothetical protein
VHKDKGEKLGQLKIANDECIGGYGQVDRIGRIFGHWAIVYFGHFLKYYRSSQHFWDTFSHG